MKKKCWIKIFVVMIFLFCIETKAETIYNFSGKRSLLDVNPDIKQKTQTQYKAEDKIKNQYKGKLKYKPNTGTTSNREYRIYVNFYVNIHNLKYKNNFEYNNEKYNKDEYIDRIKEQNSFDISVGMGYYLTQNIAVEFEYSNYEYSTFLKNDKYLYFGGRTSSSYRVNKLNSDLSVYNINFLIENNYSTIIPIFGIGFGMMKSGYLDSFYINNRQEETVRDEANIQLKGKTIYTLIAGLEYQFTDKILFSFKYKLVSSLNSRFDLSNDIKKLFGKKKNTNSADTLDFNFNINSFLIGVKYLW